MTQQQQFTNLYLALDNPTREGCLKRAELINSVPGLFGYKLNLDVLMHDAGGIVAEFISTFGRPVFADTKMWNGKRTMREIVKELAQAGAAITNVYCQAGVPALTAALEGAEGTNLQLFGLGVLTHYTDEDCQRDYRRSLLEAVRHFGERAVEAGLHGYIMPGTCLKNLSDMDIPKLVPGIRPNWFPETSANSQEQTVEPGYAFDNGASIAVCGSPIFKSPNPREALRRILNEIESAIV